MNDQLSGRWSHHPPSEAYAPRAFRHYIRRIALVGGRYLPRPLRDLFYSLDHFTATHIGAPEHRFKPLRNRDWLITLPGSGSGDGQPAWSCPECHERLAGGEGVLRCEQCARAYHLNRGVPDFFSADSPLAPAGL